MILYDLFTDNGGNGRLGLLNVIAFVVALFAALVLHELAHGLVALWNGDSTAKQYGRLTLNPIKHFDLMGLLFMLIVGFGWAKPVPVNPNNFKNRKVGAITVSIAGVVTNLVLAFFATLAALLFWRILPQSEGMAYFKYFLGKTATLMVSLNISFALFNILPLFPLDGYRFLSCFVDENKRGMRFLRRYSVYILLGLIALGYIFDYLPFVSGYSPLDLYISKLGGVIIDGFEKFWRLIFNG